MTITRLTLTSIAVLGFMTISPTAEAGAGSGLVTQLLVLNGGGTGGQGLANVLITTRSNTSVPPCANSQPLAFSLDLGTESGRSMFSTALAAFLSGATLHIQGTGACILGVQGEAAFYIFMP